MIRFGSAPRRNSRRNRPRDDRGFSLLEAIAALAIAAATFALVTELAGQMLRNWNRGSGTIASMEMLTRGISRIETDLGVALPMRSPAGDGTTVLFTGDVSQMTFAAATGFGAGDRGAELLTINVISNPNETILVRQRGPIAIPATLRDPVILMRGKLQVRFAYRDAGGRTVASWSGQPELPRAVEVQLFAANGAPIFPVAAVIALPQNFSIECLSAESEDETRVQRCPNLRRAAEEQKKQEQEAERQANQQNTRRPGSAQ